MTRARTEARDLGRAVAAAILAAVPAAAQEQDSPLRKLLEAQAREIEKLHEQVEELYGREGGEGAFVETAGGRIELGGLLQVNALAFERGLAARDSAFDLRRMRLEISGELDERYIFNVEPFFTEADVELEEAWVGAWLERERSRVLFGRMKEPFSLEEMSPRKGSEFAEFSILNQLVPAEDSGITLLGATANGALEYGAALYNGTGGDELNEDKDLAARIVWHPFAARTGCALRGFQIGASATTGRTDADVGGVELRTETRQPFLAFEPASEIDGDRTRAGVEAAWLSGPFALTAEAVRVEQDMAGAGGSDEVGFDAWYLTGSWVLTGEEKTFQGVRPARPFVKGGGCGAWQLAARISRLELDDALVATGVVAPASFPDSVTTLDVGLNWYATYDARVKLHVVRTSYGETISFGGDTFDSEDALLVQFQLGF